MVDTNLEYYKVFYYVALNLSLTKAAQKLNISQPAVSQAIRQLESGLNVKLFTRVQRGVALTKEGEALFEHVSQGYKAFEEGERAVKDMLDLETGEIVIGASDMTLRFYLLPYLEQFHERYPGIKIMVTNAPTPETLNNLKNHSIDFGVISTPFKTGDNIKSVPVRDIEDTFVAGRRYIKYKNKTLDLSELETLPIIALEANTSSRSYIDEVLKNKNVVLKPEFELATSDMIVQFALKSLGIGCVMKDFAKPYLDDGTLFELRLRELIPKRNFCVVYEKNVTLSKAGINLLKMMEAID